MSEPSNPLSDADKKLVQDDINKTTDAIKQKVIDDLKKGEVPKPVVTEPTVNMEEVEARVRAKLVLEMKAKMDAETKALEAEEMRKSMTSMSQQLTDLKASIEAKNKPSPLSGMDVKLTNPFNSEGKKYEDLTPADEKAISDATQVLFERERRR